MEWFPKHARLLLLPVFFCACDLSAQSVTNYELLAALTDSLLADFIVANLPEHDADITIRPIGIEGANNWFFEDRIAQQLHSAGVTVYLDRNDGVEVADEGYVLEYKIIQLGIIYRDIISHVDRENIERIGRAKFLVRLLKAPAGRVVWNGNLSGEQNDQVASEKRADLEDKAIPFTVGSGTVQRPLGLFKPLLVSGAAGAIVFLFFSLRSR